MDPPPGARPLSPAGGAILDALPAELPALEGDGGRLSGRRVAGPVEAGLLAGLLLGHGHAEPVEVVLGFREYRLGGDPAVPGQPSELGPELWIDGVQVGQGTPRRGGGVSRTFRSPWESVWTTVGVSWGTLAPGRVLRPL